MLVSLAIKNFAIVQQLEVQWHAAMTTITGETGAGKSIAIDALGLALGERSDASVVRAGADKAEVVASFDVSSLPSAQDWLASHDLQLDDDCLLRRVVSKEGRSRAYINGSPVPAAQLKELGSFLVSIHGQHAHQQLTKPDHQRLLLDEYANNKTVAERVTEAYRNWHGKSKEYKSLLQQQEEFSAQQQLLQYQVEELNEVDCQPDEFQQIEQEHQRLHHAQSLILDGQQALEILYQEETGNAYSAVQSALSLLHKSMAVDAKLGASVELFESALIQLDEGASELRSYLDSLEVNPERLHEVEQRLNLYMDLARKHQVQPEGLYQHHQDLIQELEQLGYCDERLQQLELEINEAKVLYQEWAKKLTETRLEYARQLNDKISQSMANLNMAGAQFAVEIDTETDLMSELGNDKINFLVSANPGQPLQPLAKVASGGELSRISLAIQVIIAQRVTTPTLLFDEVDVGVSGPTASAVGKLMRTLSTNTQVICVTHLPQVACCGHQQQFVMKQTIEGQTMTQMKQLDEKGRVEELARLLGGDKISSTTKANAKELLYTAQAA